MLTVIKHCNKVYNSNTYVIKETDTGECWLVDIGDVADILSVIGDSRLMGIFLTHTHYDHIYGLNEILRGYPDAKVYTNDFGKKALANPSDNLSVYHGEEFIIENDKNVFCIKNEEIIPLGRKYSIQAIQTPGHDKSCVCYISDNIIFTGDSYIPGHKVFAKLQNGDKLEAEKSQIFIMSLCGSRIIHPGHT